MASANAVSANIVGSRRIENHIQYVIKVSVGDISHQVCRRYRDFDALFRIMREVLPLVETSKSRLEVPSLPGKKLFGRMDPKFIASRKSQLEQWMSKVIENRHLLQLRCVFDFLEIPDSLIVGAQGSATENSEKCEDNSVLLKLSDFTNDGGEEGNAVFLTKLLSILFKESWWESSFRVFEFGSGTGLTACVMAAASTEKFGAASVVGGDVVSEYVDRFKERILANGVGSSVKALSLSSKKGDDLEGVYDSVISSFSLRRLETKDYEELIRNFVRICRGQGYIVVAEVDAILRPDESEDREKGISWRERVLSAFEILGVEPLRVHRFSIRRTAENSTKGKDMDRKQSLNESSSRIVIPSYVIIGRTPEKVRAKKKKSGTK